MDSVSLKIIPTSEASGVDQLVSEAFGYQGLHRYFDDFPIWASDQALRIGFFEKSRLLSHVGVRFARMKVRGGLVPIAMIGAVATHKDARGKGLSTRVLQEALSKIDQEGCSYTFLWGSEHDFYSKFGFHLAGEQARAPVSHLEISGASMRGLQESKPRVGFTHEIFQSFIRRTQGIQFTPSDEAWMSSHKTVEWYSYSNPFGFIAYQRGMDLPHQVHEWGGDPDQVKRLLFYLYGRDPQVQVLGTAPELFSLGFEDQSLTREALCLARTSAGWDPDFWISGLSAC